MPWDFVLILFLLGVLLPWRGTVRLRRVLTARELSSADRLAIYASTIAFQWAAAATVAWRTQARGVTPAALGLAVPDATHVVATTAGLTLIAVFVPIASLRRLESARPGEHSTLRAMVETLMPHNPLELAVFVALAITAGLCEEFLYRGFVYAVFAEVTSGSSWFAIAISAAFFAVAHLYQGPRSLLTTFLVGVALGAAREWTGSLLPGMVAHFVADLTAGVAAQAKLARGRFRVETRNDPEQRTGQRPWNTAGDYN
ncbi:MAG: CPBP family intramembrane metalloprotease [Firmicutes bacterium]|nr:CPBP family intramembrane metalloprotease [Bacillota bacterium]